MRILLVDNFDSFVYNLAQAFGALGAEPIVLRSDRSLAELEAARPDGVVISPGPGAPDESPLSVQAIRTFSGRVPVLGVCLGHQCIATAFGGRVERSPAGPVHGKLSRVSHRGTGIFVGLPSPLSVTRYHSLAVDRPPLPDELEVTATSDDGVVMGMRHKEVDVEGVQFHPESVLTEEGERMLANFLARCAQGNGQA